MKPSSHPYMNLPASSYWRVAVANAEPGQLEPVVNAPFRIAPADKVATAGSCFAQHIGRYLEQAGSQLLICEPPHPVLTSEAAKICSYGVFTARYGNIYTSRQLLQLFQRAYGRFEPTEYAWRSHEGAWIDPFRPTIQPGGFNSEREFALDRARHFAAVRRAFETLDVLVFTLGLTEAWRDQRDGAIFPICPGVSGGRFDKKRHDFVNLGVTEVLEDLRDFMNLLRDINPKCRIILTVSPVPLAATAEPRHVLEATVYSKSVLRVAAEMASREVANVAYFPSYEIIASGFGGDYYAQDKRNVTPEGVEHAMRVFLTHYTGPLREGGLMNRLLARAKATPPARQPAPASLVVMEALQAMCDEEALDPEFSARRA